MICVFIEISCFNSELVVKSIEAVKLKEKYFAMYSSFIDAKYYYWYYRQRSVGWDNLINIILSITSIGGIGAWTVWRQLPFVWAAIVGMSQIINAFRKFLPFSGQISATNSLIPEIDMLVNDVDHDYFKVLNDLYDNEINELIFQYNKRFIALENRLTKGSNFPMNKKCFKKAEIDRENYFYQAYEYCENQTREEAAVTNEQQR